MHKPDGDSARTIDWKSLAKTNDILVKRFVGGGESKIQLTWAATGSLTHTEERLSQLCKWILEAERLGASYGLELPHRRIEPSAGSVHRTECLRELALFNSNARS